VSNSTTPVCDALLRSHAMQHYELSTRMEYMTSPSTTAAVNQPRNTFSSSVVGYTLQPSFPSKHVRRSTSSSIYITCPTRQNLPLTIFTGPWKERPTTNVPKSRYRALLRMNLQWRHLKSLKRGSRGHAESGVEGTANGELAIMCPSCPRPGVNLSSGWEKVEESMRWVCRLRLSNFF